MNAGGSLIVQSNLSILLDEGHMHAAEARELMLRIAVVIKKTGVLHTYQLTAMSLWNGLVSGLSLEEVLSGLTRHAKYEIPMQVLSTITRWAGRLGRLRLKKDGERLLLEGDEAILQELREYKGITQWVQSELNTATWEIDKLARGLFKQELTRIGYPVLDQAGYHVGHSLPVRLRERTLQGQEFSPRDYQEEAIRQFLRQDCMHDGSGVVVLPCGTGKTIVGLLAIAAIGAETLILTSSVTSALQWKQELVDKTTMLEEEIGIYCGKYKQVRPITIATYQLLTYRQSKQSPFYHMKIFSDRDWGLIVYDEVHMLPAPIFRITASIQATRRLGLTATLIREDGCAEDVYSLIGPKLYDLQWKQAEASQHISSVSCTEVRVPLHPAQESLYQQSSVRAQLRIAAENDNKLSIVKLLLKKHKGKPTLIIGQYLKQLHAVASELRVPVLTGNVAQQKRQELYEQFRAGEVEVLVVSKVANVAVDLPDAAVAIQLSGSFGSRQEEAQRIGRLLRPKKTCNEAWFYSLVTNGTKETEFAMKRQLFMLEQGYAYTQVTSSTESDIAPIEDEEVMIP